jgi:hypothetical protein
MPVFFKVELVNVMDTSVLDTFFVISDEVMVVSSVLREGFCLHVGDRNIKFICDQHRLLLNIVYCLGFSDKRFRFFGFDYLNLSFAVFIAGVIDNFKDILVLGVVRGSVLVFEAINGISTAQVVLGLVPDHGMDLNGRDNLIINLQFSELSQCLIIFNSTYGIA